MIRALRAFVFAQLALLTLVVLVTCTGVGNPGRSAVDFWLTAGDVKVDAASAGRPALPRASKGATSQPTTVDDMTAVASDDDEKEPVCEMADDAVVDVQRVLFPHGDGPRVRYASPSYTSRSGLRVRCPRGPPV